ncbi:nitrous oxide-stimulated promoter family protein [Sporomusa aerivorans]|uniref:nitrous oxide-stimulated promoter family protein n=1 Tax=Sporomusa aerivorans TaxID=204936 RepID=UPI00352B39C7
MLLSPSRVLREQVSIEKMITIYCRAKHQQYSGLCAECSLLLEYALQRLARCIFREKKPVCAKCPIHCYRKDMRDKIIVVMRYAGPRMLYKHPLLAVLHLIDSWKTTPPAGYRAGK